MKFFIKKGKSTVDLIIISCNLVFPDFVQIRIKTKKKKSVKSNEKGSEKINLERLKLEEEKGK